MTASPLRQPRPARIPVPRVQQVPFSFWIYSTFEVLIQSRERSRGQTLQPAGNLSYKMNRSSTFLLAFIAFMLWSLSAIAHVDPNRWRWSNPAPHGNNVLDMLVAPDFAVQVGDAGTVYTQGADERWAPAITGVTNYLRGVALMGSRIIVVGENGCILYSDDGRTFQPAQLSQGAGENWFESVAASAQRAVAVGDNGNIYSSTNGATWSRVNSGTTEWLRSVAFGGGAFVAVGENGTILRSPSSGGSWTKITPVTSADLNRVRFLGTGSAAQFWAVGNNGVLFYSATGGAPWSPVSSGTTNTLNDVSINDTGILLVGDEELRFRASGSPSWTNYLHETVTNGPPVWTYLSAWGTTNFWLVAGRSGLLLEGLQTNGSALYGWKAVSDSSHAWLWDVTVQRGICVAAGDLATILTSLDGILWAREIVPLPHTNTVLLGVGGSTNTLLAVGNAGNVLISRAGLTNVYLTNYVGTNIVITNVTFDAFGVIWTNLPAFTTNNLQGLAASDSLFVVSGDRGSIFTSPDGSNFVARVTPTTNFLSGLATGPSGWVAVGNRGTLLHANADAVSWSPVPVGTTNWLYRVRYVGGVYIAVGQNGAVYTSASGTDWTPRSSGTTRWLNDVTFLDGTWYIAGNQGLLLASTNLANWTPLPVPTIKSLCAAGTHEGHLLLSGVEGVVLRNPVVPNMSPVNFLGYHRSLATNSVPLNQTNFTSVVSAYELFLFGGLPDQWFQFQSSTNIAGSWQTNATLELFDASGTMYLIRTRELTNTPPREFYRTSLQP